jgi:hypothetical protein
MGDTTVLCVVCRRREPPDGHVCDTCQARIVTGLDDLLDKMDALHLAVVPTAAPAGDRVTTSRIGAPLPVRLDALSLIGPGNESVTAMLHPMVRRWSASRTVTVVTVRLNRWVQEDRTVTDWFQELALDDAGHPILVADDDQIGVLPPREWLDSWVRAWRAALHLHTPKRNPVHDWDTAPTRHDPVRSGSGPDRADDRFADPLRDEWEIRYGHPPRNKANQANVEFLKTWLDKACQLDIGISAFAAELHTLVAELARVLGDTPDQQWLGRCPATLMEHDGGTTTCAAGLWQDPHASQVVCPRCHSTWGPRPFELLHLAREIRRVWPVDRRRRYAAAEIDDLPLPACPGCANEVRVRWREVTATLDTVRWWRPVGIECPNECPDAERLL